MPTAPARALAALALPVLLALSSCAVPLAAAAPETPAARRLPLPGIGPDARAEPSVGGVLLTATRKGALTGRVIVVDPGHAGVYRKSISGQLVDTAAGRRPCVQVGGTAKDGTPEHAVNWTIADRLAAELRRRGADVVVTRPDDNGVGPCNNERAEIANRARADLLISVHVDGNDTAGLRGFHIITSPAMAGGATVETASTQLAENTVRRLRTKTPLPPANYVGTQERPIQARRDLAVLNGLRTTPGVLVETGNIVDARDWALLKKADTKQAIAGALADAAVDTLA